MAMVGSWFSPLMMLQGPLMLGALFILTRAAFCIAANLTTNESLVWRYPYLFSADGRYWNYFDRGVLANCLQFWVIGVPRPDWGLIYQQEKQARHLDWSHNCIACNIWPCVVQRLG